MIKIKDLTPGVKGDITLTFQVESVIQRSSDNQEIFCRVVDQTGIITAFFGQFGSLINEGNVLLLKGLRCKVVDHHLRLQMIKNTIIVKKPLKMGFKDLENDLSKKFYIEDNKNKPNEGNEKKSNVESKQEIRKQQKMQKAKKVEKQIQTDLNETKFMQREKKPVKYLLKDKSQPHKNQKPIISQKHEQYNDNRREQQRINRQNKKQKIESSYRKQSQDLTKKKKFVEKNVDYQQKQHNEGHKEKKELKRILLKDLSKHQQKNINLLIFVELKFKIQHEKYFLCRVADSSGSAYLQFNSNTKLNDKSWYSLNQFKVYGDKKYGFVAVQQNYSSLQIVQDCGEIVEKRVISFTD